jgi:hypothetical protein
MRCPKCQAEVQEWHFYCQNCHIQVQGYGPETENHTRGRVERAGARVINALVGILVITVLVLTARAVQWTEIYAAIRGDAVAPARADTAPKARRALHAKSDASRTEDKDSTPAKITEEPKGKKDTATTPETNPAAKSETDAASDAPPTGVESMNAMSGDAEGLVAINSDVPARIYINGQFSGTTPRTVKMKVGDLQIRLIADGYDDWTRRIKLKSRQQLGITAAMKKRDAPGN